MPDKPNKTDAASAPDPKSKFREALDRKRSQQHADNGPAQNDSKVRGVHDKAGGKRSFRRKSG